MPGDDDAILYLKAKSWRELKARVNALETTQRLLHGILLSRWLPDLWLAKRFLEVV